MNKNEIFQMMQKDALQIGLIGCGQISRVGHGPAIVADGRARIAAVCDPNAENRDRFARMFSVSRTYPDHLSMLAREKLDAVIVASLPWHHAGQVRDVAAAGIPMLCEKPMATSVQDCKSMIHAAGANGVYLQICHNKRFEFGFQRIKEMLAAKTIGASYHVSIDWNVYVPNYDEGIVKTGLQAINKLGFHPEKTYGDWRIKDARFDGGIFFDDGGHYIDLARFFFGEIESVSCAARRCMANRSSDDFVTATLTMSDKTVVVLTRSLVALGPKIYGIECGHIYGDKGTLRFNAFAPHRQKAIKVDIFKIPNLLLRSYMPAVLPYGRRKTGYFRQMRYFIDHLTGARPLERKFDGPWAATPEDGAAAVAWTSAAFKSAREGIKIFRKDIEA